MDRILRFRDRESGKFMACIVADVQFVSCKGYLRQKVLCSKLGENQAGFIIYCKNKINTSPTFLISISPTPAT